MGVLVCCHTPGPNLSFEKHSQLQLTLPPDFRSPLMGTPELTGARHCSLSRRENEEQAACGFFSYALRPRRGF